MYLMVFMAQWQADKAEYKDNLHDKIVARKDLPAITMQELPATEDERLFLPVVIKGRYDAEHTFLLDNRILNGRVGFDIYTPLRLTDGRSILVNRGFLPQGRTRQDLPVFETPDSMLMVKG